MMKLKIDKEFEAFLPRATDEEDADLERQLMEEGCTDPIRVWGGKDVIIDGHRRYRLCERNGYKFKVVEVQLPSRAAVYAWMAANQLNCRNLTDEQRRYYLGKQYLAEKKPHGGVREQVENNSTCSDSGQSERTAERIGELHGVAGRTVRNSATFTKLLDAVADKAPEIRNFVLNDGGKLTTRQLKKLAELPTAEAKKLVTKIIARKREERPAALPTVIVHDGTGKLIPSTSPFVEVFADREWFLAKIKLYKAELADVRRMAHSPGGAALHVEECAARLKGLIAEIEQRTPHAVCLVCKGEKMDPAEPKKECPGCGGLGWQDALRHSVSIQKGRQKRHV